MVINRKIDDIKEDIKFVNYTGHYPCLCNGILTLCINGINHTFGYGNDCEYPRFWHSGGSCNWRSCDVYRNEWEIDYEEIPDEFKKYADIFDILINEHIEYGCCGGCL